MIELEKYKQKHFDDLNAYKLNDIQSQFTASIDYCINERKDEEDSLKTIVSILYNNLPVGFFVLDKGKDKYLLSDNDSSILIRSFSINPKYQGKGIGSEAMKKVSEFVKENIFGIDELILSVNVKNTNAYRVYKKAGYIDNKKTIDGPMGEQNILSKYI